MAKYLHGRYSFSPCRNMRFISFLSKIIIYFLTGLSLYASPLKSDFLISLNMVETGGRTGLVVGKDGEIGPFQISKAYWRDAKRHGNLDGSFINCTNWDYSVKVITIYLNHYAPKSVKNNNYEILARIQNGGPEGYGKKSTLTYWEKFKKIYESQKIKKKK